MKRYDIDAGIAESGRIRLEVCADPQGDWVKWEDAYNLIQTLELLRKLHATAPANMRAVAFIDSALNKTD